MIDSEMKTAQLRHDLRSLIEPFKIVMKLMKDGKTDQALKIQEAAVDLLTKTVKSLESTKTETDEGSRN